MCTRALSHTPNTQLACVTLRRAFPNPQPQSLGRRRAEFCQGDPHPANLCCGGLLKPTTHSTREGALLELSQTRPQSHSQSEGCLHPPACLVPSIWASDH